MIFCTMRSRLLCAQGLRRCCQCLLLFQGLWGRAGELLLGTVEPSQIALGREVIYLHTSRTMGFLVGSGEADGKPVGTPGGVQWMKAPEWFVDPLSANALAHDRIYGH